MLLSPNTATTHQKALCRFESIQPFAAQDKDFVVATDAVHAALEVVLHASVHDSDILQAFVSYVDTLGGTTHLDRALRSEERRVGKECVSTCRSRWTRYN